jgi:uncharacterized membrane protein YfcA
MLTLTLVFFVIALLYATVGFGGGTSYIAMLAVSGIAYTMIPKISLICNILVVTGGCYHFMKNGHFNKKLVLPFVMTSVPMAYLGGSFPLTEKTYYILLATSLVLCGIRILFIRDKHVEEIRMPGFNTSLATGAVLGLLSGMVGIGGGIFLSPILINMGWARSKDAAAVASMFILVNSLAGFVGQITKDTTLPDFMMYAPLFIAVIIGGQIGSRIGTHKKVSYALIQKGTGILTLIISVRMLFKYV